MMLTFSSNPNLLAMLHKICSFHTFNSDLEFAEQGMKRMRESLSTYKITADIVFLPHAAVLQTQRLVNN